MLRWSPVLVHLEVWTKLNLYLWDNLVNELNIEAVGLSAWLASEADAIGREVNFLILDVSQGDLNEDAVLALSPLDDGVQHLKCMWKD